MLDLVREAVNLTLVLAREILSPLGLDRNWSAGEDGRL